MDINGLTSTSTTGAQTGAAAKSVSGSLSLFKAQQSGQMLSLIPPVSSTPGLGLNVDIYAAVGMQSQGYLSGGLMSIELANISLGIDMSKAAQTGSASDAKDTAAPATSTGDAAAETAAPAASHGNAILDRILKEEGYQAPAADPYVAQTDFFAKTDSSATPAAAQPANTTSPYYSNSDLANPGLGTLLNSLG